jgi:16S rRNA (guanine966-N2)-methyltransferase
MLSADPDIRPTPDRARETLFNWLQPIIEGANCLDLYAGSGVLGFEALSRGAAGITLVEKNKKGAAMLAQQAEELGSIAHKIVCDDALNYLSSSSEQFDIVFLDPPFAENLLQNTCETLLNRGHLRSGARVYVESDSEITIELPYTILKQARAGKVHYVLLECGI